MFKTAKATTEQALAAGAEPLKLVQEFMVPAMDEVGRRFEQNEYFVPELLISARAMKASLELIRPLLVAGGVQPVGRVAIGTVKGDLHDIGKNLVAAMLEGGGFEVIDLGVNVEAEKLVAAVRENNVNIIAMSALLTTTMPAMKTTIDALSAASSVSTFEPFDTSVDLKIGPGVQRLECQYTALSFTAPERIRFRYQLAGFDPDWVEADGRRVAEYSRLAPGHYHFRVVACNADGVWNEQGTTLAVTCVPAYWQTVWFRLLCISAMLGSVGWAVRRWAVRRLRQRLAILEQQHALEKERTRIARDIHDELGALLTEISLLSDHGRKHRGQPATVDADFGRISSTARTAVQAADGIVWAVNPRNDSLSHLANYMVHFAEDFFRLTSIRCRLDVPALVPSVPVSAHQRHHLLLATKEACNNVVRHSSASEVWVRLTVTEREFSITVEDNGSGFDLEAVPADHDGLLNLRQRLADLGGRVELHSTPGQGTRVRIIVPLNPQTR